MAEEQKKELIPISVWLSGRSYRLRIVPEEEEAVRKAVKQADAKIADMRNNYAGKDDQDFIAMCLLSYAADGAVDTFQHPLLKKELDEMNRKVDKALGE